MPMNNKNKYGPKNKPKGVYQKPNRRPQGRGG
jgi:hypothetical protein